MKTPAFPARTLVFLLGLCSLVAHLRAQGTDLQFHGSSATATTGENVTLLFRTDNFFSITSGMGTIQWDPQVVDYVRAGDFGIPELSESSFSKTEDGMLIFNWQANNLLGTTIPNGAVVFSLTFGVRGDAGTSTTVAFTNGFYPLRFESPESFDLPVSTTPGNISVVPEPAPFGLATIGLLGLVPLIRRHRSVYCFTPSSVGHHSECEGLNSRYPSSTFQ